MTKACTGESLVKIFRRESNFKNIELKVAEAIKKVYLEINKNRLGSNFMSIPFNDLFKVYLNSAKF